MRYFYIVIIVLLAITFGSCRKLGELGPHPLLENYSDTIKYFHLTDYTFKQTGSLSELIITGHFTVDWDILAQQKPYVTKVQLVFDPYKVTLNKDSMPYYFKQYVTVGKTYCPKLILISENSTSSNNSIPLGGDCFTVPN